MGHKHPVSRGFLDENKIMDLLSTDSGESPRPSRTKEKSKYKKQNWYEPGEHHDFTYGHSDTLGSTGTRGDSCYTCDTITDKWVEWLLTTPKNSTPFANPNNAYGDTNAFLFGDKKCDTYVYFTTVSPFQTPDFRRIVMTKHVPLLVPVYNVISSPQIFPSRAKWTPMQWLKDDIVPDLAGVYNDGISATFDGEEFYGCSVIRMEPLPIAGIPKDNSIGVSEHVLRETHSTMEVYHGGFWLLVHEKKLTPGDHLLKFEAQSRNYEIEAKIMISVLV